MSAEQIIDLVAKLTPAFVTLVIGVVAASIAVRQYRVAKEKLRLDLFDKRFAVYQHFLDYHSEFMRAGEFTGEALRHLLQARSSAAFLFGEDVLEALDRIWARSFGLRAADRQMKALLQTRQGETAANKWEQTMAWLMDQPKELKPIFGRYLHFKD